MWAVSVQIIKRTNMTSQELKQEKLDEMRQDLLHEQHIRADYDNFLDYIEDHIGDLNDVIDTIREAHRLYGYEFDLNEFIKEIR